MRPVDGPSFSPDSAEVYHVKGPANEGALILKSVFFSRLSATGPDPKSRLACRVRSANSCVTSSFRRIGANPATEKVKVRVGCFSRSPANTNLRPWARSDPVYRPVD